MECSIWESSYVVIWVQEWTQNQNAGEFWVVFLFHFLLNVNYFLLDTTHVIVNVLNEEAFNIAADVLYDLGTGLEVLSPLCPHLFLEVAGLGNFAKV